MSKINPVGIIFQLISDTFRHSTKRRIENYKTYPAAAWNKWAAYLTRDNFICHHLGRFTSFALTVWYGVSCRWEGVIHYVTAQLINMSEYARTHAYWTGLWPFCHLLSHVWSPRIPNDKLCKDTHNKLITPFTVFVAVLPTQKNKLLFHC